MQDFLEECIADTAEIGLGRLGEHGGYVDPQSFGIYAEQEATGSNGVDLFTGADFVIPYWHYLASQNNCQNQCLFASEEPPLFKSNGGKSIESQIAAYINSHITDCTKQFAGLAAQGIIVTPNGAPTSDVQLLRTGGIARLHWPLTVTIGDSTRAYADFSAPLDIKFPQIYDAAELLTQIQSRAKVFESLTKNMITAFSGINRDKLPPMWATDVQFGKQVSWSKSQVQQRLADLLTSQVALVQVATSKNYQYRPRSTKLGESLYNAGTLIPGNESFSGYEITFTYLPDWGVYFDLDCNGDICQPQSAFNDMLPLVGLTRYTFAYDLSYPVLVTIYDPAAFYGKGYTFQYLVEVNLRNNEPLAADFVPLRQLTMGGGKELCEEQHKTAGPLTVYVRDTQTNAPVPNMPIGFNCAGTGCILGETDENGVFSSPFPSCINGQISAVSQDYVAEGTTITTQEDQPLTVNLQASLIKDVPFSVKKWNVVKGQEGWVSQSNPVDLESYEEVILTLSRKHNAGEPDVVALSQYKDGEAALPLKLIPGTYELHGQILSYAPVTIPHDRRCYGGLVEQCFTLPGSSFNETSPLMVGTFKADITITQEMLSGMTFFVPVFDFAHTSILVMEDISMPARIEWQDSTFQPIGGLS